MKGPSLKTLISKVFLLVLLASFILGSFQTSAPLYAQLTDTDEDIETDLEESIEITSPGGKRDSINFNIFEDIARARAMLGKGNLRF